MAGMTAPVTCAFRVNANVDRFIPRCGAARRSCRSCVLQHFVF